MKNVHPKYQDGRDDAFPAYITTNGVPQDLQEKEIPSLPIPILLCNCASLLASLPPLLFHFVLAHITSHTALLSFSEIKTIKILSIYLCRISAFILDCLGNQRSLLA